MWLGDWCSFNCPVSCAPKDAIVPKEAASAYLLLLYAESTIIDDG